MRSVSFRTCLILATVVAGSAHAAAVPANVTIGELRAGFADGSLSCAQVTRHYLDRIAAYDKQGPAINAMITVNPAAMAQARALDAARDGAAVATPLWCVPVVLKDNYDTADMPTTAASRSLAGAQPEHDAFSVARLRDQGALIIGKTNLSEFALTGISLSSLGGQTRNPYDLTRTPGGSSGGTGAALAADFAVAGTGSDTVNSVRSPASANGVVGLRPTAGLISRDGIVPVSYTQDAAGPLARTVTDVAIMLDAMAGYDPNDPVSAFSVGHIPDSYVKAVTPGGLNGLRVGVLRTLFGNGAENAPVNQVMDTALETLSSQGATLVEIDDSRLFTDDLSRAYDVQKYEYKQMINAYLADHGDHVPVHSLAQILDSGQYNRATLGKFLTAAAAVDDGMTQPDYYERLAGIDRLKTTLAGVMAAHDVDILVYPEQRQLVAPISEQAQPQRNGILAALTGVPVVTLSAGRSAATDNAPLGVPVGLSMLGRPWSEPLLLRAAYAFEQAMPARRAPQSTPPLNE
ncbi:amidase family protein [Salinisphaera sp. T31B1]|uniref:amidase family protein n=1 Tax=Salinisphaera sp. T31B1 TaxID=727963 RepID=UPI00333F6DAC